MLTASHDLSITAIVILLSLGLFAFLNLKALPLAHSIRLLPSVYRLVRPRLFGAGGKRASAKSEVRLQPQDQAQTLFQTHTLSSHVAPLDLDVNIHKSNSTFFADADISRAELLSRLFSQALVDVTATAGASGGRRPKPANLILAGSQGRFLRELKPFQSYDVVSRILAWDDANLHVATYFVQRNLKVALLGEKGTIAGPAELLRDDKLRKGIFAVLVSRYVVRVGRVKVTPVELLRAAGIGGFEEVEVEEARLRGLDYVKNCML